MDIESCEVSKVIEGYTVAVRGAVIGRFRDVYFMRSAGRRVDLEVSTTDRSALHAQWRKFRNEVIQTQQSGDGTLCIEPDVQPAKVGL